VTTEERFAKRIVDAIIKDGDKRAGGSFDYETEQAKEVRAAWERIVVDVLTKGEGSE
jgi:hypothetical protein